MELRQLHYFLAVARHESFTRAAEHVHISQPSLSVQISALEDELGTRLLDRLGRKVAVTQAGELFRQHAERALRESTRPHRSFRSYMEPLAVDSLSASCPPSIVI